MSCSCKNRPSTKVVRCTRPGSGNHAGPGRAGFDLGAGGPTDQVRVLTLLWSPADAGAPAVTRGLADPLDHLPGTLLRGEPAPVGDQRLSESNHLGGLHRNHRPARFEADV